MKHTTVQLDSSFIRIHVFCRMTTHLDQQWVAKSQSTFQVLPEGIIQKACSSDFAILILIHNELCGLARGIDDQWIPTGKSTLWEVLKHVTAVNGQIMPLYKAE